MQELNTTIQSTRNITSLASVCVCLCVSLPVYLCVNIIYKYVYKCPQKNTSRTHFLVYYDDSDTV